MSWFDDLTTRAKQSMGDMQKDIGSYLGSIKVEPVVKVGAPATGNQSAAQIASGQYGGQAGIPGSTQPAKTINNANPMAGIAGQMGNYLPILLGAAALVFIFKGRK